MVEKVEKVVEKSQSPKPHQSVHERLYAQAATQFKKKQQTKSFLQKKWDGILKTPDDSISSASENKSASRSPNRNGFSTTVF